MKKNNLIKSILSLVLLFTTIITVNSQQLINPDWGFQDFSAPTVYNVTSLTQSAVQAKIDEANSNGGGTVIVPAGTIELSSWLVLKDNVKLKGTLDGNGNHLTTFIAKKDAFYDENDFTIIKAAGVANVTIENIILDGNNNFASGISMIYGTHNALVANNIVKNIGIAKAETIEDSKNWPEYQKSPSGINCWYNDGYTTIRNNVVMNVSKHGIGLNRRNLDEQKGHFIVQNNRIDNCYMSMDISSTTRWVEALGNECTNCLYGLKIVNTWDVNFHDNKVYNCDDTPWWDQWLSPPGWNDGTGTSLVLQEAELANPPRFPGEGTLKNIIIKDNILSPTDGKGQWTFWGVSDPNSKITFTNNTSTPPSGNDIKANFTYSANTCSSNVVFTNTSTGTITSYMWKFGDNETSTLPAPTHTYKTSGTYTVELTVGDGTDSDTKTEQITVNFSPKPTNVSGVNNGDGTISLSASGTGTINWYDVATGGTPLATGNNVKVTSSKTTFYAENTTGGGTTYNGGKKDKGTTGEYYIYEDADAIWGLAFNAKSDFTLKSVKIYNQGSDYTGSRTFTVKDANGTVVATKDINIVDGEQRLNLNFSINKGDNYRLLAENPKKGIWRDKTGTTLNWPYDIGGIVSITSSIKHDGTVVNTENYFFFYDWEIESGVASCSSERVSTVITTVQENEGKYISIYPNPSNGLININLDNDIHNLDIIIYNSFGQIVKTEEFNNTNNISLNLEGLPQGVYFINLKNNDMTLRTEKISIIK